MKKHLRLLLILPLFALLSCENRDTIDLLSAGIWTVTEAYRGSVDVSAQFTAVPHTIRFLTNRTYNTEFPSTSGTDAGNYDVRGSQLLVTPNSTGVQQTWIINNLETNTLEIELQFEFIGVPTDYRLVFER